MSSFENEAELVSYCGLYCRLCDYYTSRIREVARQALEMVEKHTELRIFAERSGGLILMSWLGV